MKKVLVIELNNYHTETFPIYENVLPRLMEEDMVFEYYVLPQKYEEVQPFYKSVHAICSKTVHFFIRKLQLRKFYFKRKINRLIAEQKADIVVFNSVEPDRHLQVFHEVDGDLKIGIVHNPAKITYQKAPNERLYVLNENIFKKYARGLELDGYMLPFYPPVELKIPKKTDGKIIIAVQGLVKFNRRDYSLVLDVAKEMKQRNMQQLCFNIIGNIGTKDGQKLKQMIQEACIEEYFILHGYLSDGEFLQAVGQCDYIMTALSEAYSQYFTDKMTASYSHSATFKIPMILSRENAAAWDIPGNSALIYDSVDGLVSSLQTSDHAELAEQYSMYVDGLIDKNLKMLKARHVSQ